jgi:hypothetical protein
MALNSLRRSAGVAISSARVDAGYRWRFHGRHVFDDRSRGHGRALIVLAGHKPVLWPWTLERVAREAPADLDVCVVSPGLVSEPLRAVAATHGWSYLGTEHGHVSLGQNLAIRAHPRAELIYKLDEDIFIGPGYFEDLLAGWERVAAAEEYAPGFCAPVLNVNGYSYREYLRALGLEDEYRRRFGALRRAGADIPVQADPEAAIWLWERGLPVDDTARRIAAQPFASSAIPHRFSIGAILFERGLWDRMRAFRRTARSPGLGDDEAHLCSSCVDFSRVMTLVHNVYAGHFGFGAQEPRMRAAFESRLPEF